MFRFAKRLATAPFKAVTPKSKSKSKSNRSSLKPEDVPDVMHLHDIKPHIVDFFVSSPVLTVSITQKGKSDPPDVYVVTPNESQKEEESLKAEPEPEGEEEEEQQQQQQQNQDDQKEGAPSSPSATTNA